MAKSNRNKIAGFTLERDIVHLLNEKYPYLPKVGTARELSRDLDSKKIDIVTRSIMDMNELGLAIQAKSSTVTITYQKILGMLKDNLKTLKLDLIPVIFHKHTKKVGERFMPKNHYALLYREDFLQLYTDKIRYKKAYELLNQYFECIPEDLAKELKEDLKELNL